MGTESLFDRHSCDLAELIKGVSGRGLRYSFDTILNVETYTTALKALADRHPVYSVYMLSILGDTSRFPKKPDESE